MREQTALPAEREVLIAAPWRDHDAPAVDVRANQDPATKEALRTLRRRGRRPIVIVGLAMAALVAATVIIDQVQGSDAVPGPLGAADLVVGLVLIATVGTHSLRRRTFSRAASALADSPWSLVEVVLMKGAPVDGGVPVVLVLEPATGEPVGTWLVDKVGRRGWPVRDLRQWGYLAVADDGRSAALAPVDRQTLTVLRRRSAIGTAGSLHEWAWTTAKQRWSFPPTPRPGLMPNPHLAPGAAGATHMPGDRSHWPNRPLTFRERCGILGSLIVVALALTVSTVHQDRQDAAHERTLLADGSRSTAEVTNVHHGKNFVQVTVLIVDGNGKGWSVRTSVASSTDLTEGQRVQVAYDPEDPGDLVIVGETRAPNDFPAFVAWAGTALVAVRFAWQTWRRRRRDAERRTTANRSSVLHDRGADLGSPQSVLSRMRIDRNRRQPLGTNETDRKARLPRSDAQTGCRVYEPASR